MRTLRFSIIVDMKGVEKGGFLEYTNKIRRQVIAKQVRNLDSNREKIRSCQDFQEVDVGNRILRHENKTDRDICL